MKITTRAEYLWSPRQERYILLRDIFHYSEKVAQCKGASANQNALADSQKQFYDTLQKDYGTSFANQQNVLASLQNTLNPIVSAGPNQYGFNAAETNNLNSSVINNTATQYANTARALGQQQGAQGGGNTLLPSGVASQQQAGLAASAANQTATGLTAVQQAGYQQGNEQYNRAVGGLGNVAGQYGSGAESLAGSANNAGSNAASTLNQINQENNAASPWGFFGGLLGGAVSSFAGSLGGSFGKGRGSSGSSGGGSGGGSYGEDG